ncbi:MAG TPA: hypothetical protein VLG09_04250 [Candidatus Saccharimonadales bacterium]|nr:hypothetical protein [Candidatus Saccharimonadales bacterium]
MAKRIFTTGGITLTPTNAGSQATSGGYMHLLGTSTTQITDVLEAAISGMATASAVCAAFLARVSTLGTGGASALAGNNSDGPMHPATAALASPVTVAVAYVTNQPIPSSSITDAKISLGLNLFGGIFRWNAAPTQQWSMVGSALGPGTTILWNNLAAGGATGAADAHIIYETY